jgi:hypothetical protein
MGRQVVKKIRLIPVLLVAALLIPVSVAPGRGPAVQDACAMGKCCFEPSSICVGSESDLPGYYYTILNKCYSRTASSPTVQE